jgi:hypothetical protein
MSIRTTVAALAIAGPSLADGAATAISGVLAAGAAQPAPAVLADGPGGGGLPRPEASPASVGSGQTAASSHVTLRILYQSPSQALSREKLMSVRATVAALAGLGLTGPPPRRRPRPPSKEHT